VLRLGARRDLLAESKKQKAWKRFCEIPSLGPIRAAVLLGILQTPHRFRTKRQLWNYGGLAIEMHSSADHRSLDGHLQRSRKNVLVRGLN
jgi:transposase